MKSLTSMAKATVDMIPLSVMNMLGSTLVSLRNARNDDRHHQAIKELVTASHAEFPPANGNVLIVPFLFGSVNTWVEIVLGYLFRQWGFHPSFVFCDQTVNYCEQIVLTRVRKPLCAMCRYESRRVSSDYGLDTVWLRDQLGPEQLQALRRMAFTIPLEEIPDLCHREVRIGRQAMASLYRHLLRSTVVLSEHETKAREYLFSALVSCEAAHNMIDRFQPKHVLISHGIYSTWGTFTEVCRVRGVPVVIWDRHYRKDHLIFAHNYSHHQALIEEPANLWEKIELSEQQRQETMQYLVTKQTGSADYTGYYPKESRPLPDLTRRLDLAPDKPIVGMFPNICWDAQLHYGSPVFQTMSYWIIETINYFASRPELQLVIRVHPAEVRGAYETQEKVVDILAAQFPALPTNIRVIDSTDDITSYDLAQIVDAALVYGTKFGIELAVRGVPVIVAGESYYKHKGITFDAANRDEYFSLLNKLPDGLRMGQAAIEQAIKYAYYYNFMRLSYFSVAECNGLLLKRFKIKSLDELRPGANPHLDSIMESILNLKPFIYIAEPEVSC